MPASGEKEVKSRGRPKKVDGAVAAKPKASKKETVLKATKTIKPAPEAAVSVS